MLSQKFCQKSHFQFMCFYGANMLFYKKKFPKISWRVYIHARGGEGAHCFFLHQKKGLHTLFSSHLSFFHEDFGEVIFCHVTTFLSLLFTNSVTICEKHRFPPRKTLFTTFLEHLKILEKNAVTKILSKITFSIYVFLRSKNAFL